MTKASVSSYDPGKATPARKMGDNLFAIDSFRGEGSYLVNLKDRTCTCPHFARRLAGTHQPCKHILTAAEQATYLEYLEKARSCEDSQLEKLLARYLDDPMISGAIRMVRAERKEKLLAADYDAHMKAVFA